MGRLQLVAHGTGQRERERARERERERERAVRGIEGWKCREGRNRRRGGGSCQSVSIFTPRPH